MSYNARLGGLAALLLAAVAAGPAALVGVPAYAGSTAAGAAADGTGCVGVVVDFTRLGVGVQTGCAKNDPASGLEALTGAGFTFTPRPRDYLVCQINGQPACEDTTSDNFWSYWHREPGSSAWTYSSVGPASHDPEPGSTEGWVWQEGGKAAPPGIAQDDICPVEEPDPEPTKTRDPDPSERPRPKPTISATGTGGAGEPTGASGAAGRKSETRREEKGRGKDRLRSPQPRTPPPSATARAFAAATPLTDPAATDTPPAGGDGAWLGLLVGGGLVVGLAAAAVARARRAPPAP